MRIAIAGSGNLGASLWRGLEDSRHEIVALVCDGRQTRGIRRWINPAVARLLGGRESVTRLARRAGVPLVWIDKMTPEELAPLAAIAPDLLLVGGFAIILKPPILQIPRIGCINMHSSLLPEHRGPNPFHAAIRAGDTETGVTFHVVDEGIDTGPILDQTPFPITPEDTLFTVYRRACQIGEERVAAVIDAIEANGLQGAPQAPGAGSYDKKPTVDDAWIDWNDTAEQIDRMCRALCQNPMPRFLHQGRIVSVARATFDPMPVDAAPGTVLKNYPTATIATGLGTVTLNVAFCTTPVPWIWPAPWSRPAIGDCLSGERRP